MAQRGNMRVLFACFGNSDSKADRTMYPIVRKLKEGDLRQKEKPEEVVADVPKKPQFRHQK